MRRLVPRMRLRTLLILVVLAAFGLAYDRARGRSAYYRGRWAFQAQLALEAESELQQLRKEKERAEDSIRQWSAMMDRHREELASARKTLEASSHDRQADPRIIDLMMEKKNLTDSAIRNDLIGISNDHKYYSLVGDMIEKAGAKVDRHRAMASRYRYASEHPWVSVSEP